MTEIAQYWYCVVRTQKIKKKKRHFNQLNTCMHTMLRRRRHICSQSKWNREYKFCCRCLNPKTFLAVAAAAGWHHMARRGRTRHTKNYCRIVDNRHASQPPPMQSTHPHQKISIECVSPFFLESMTSKNRIHFCSIFRFQFRWMSGFFCSCLRCTLRPPSMWPCVRSARVLVRFPDLLFSRYFADVNSTRQILLHVLH